MAFPPKPASPFSPNPFCSSCVATALLGLVGWFGRRGHTEAHVLARPARRFTAFTGFTLFHARVGCRRDLATAREVSRRKQKQRLQARRVRAFWKAVTVAHCTTYAGKRLYTLGKPSKERLVTSSLKVTKGSSSCWVCLASAVRVRWRTSPCSALQNKLRSAGCACDRTHL